MDLKHVKYKVEMSTDGSDEDSPRYRGYLSSSISEFQSSRPDLIKLALITGSNGLSSEIIDSGLRSCRVNCSI